jgi:hypothetical protein
MAPSKRAEEAMFQLNETEMWREHRQGLLSEAEGERFTLRIGWVAGLRRMLVVMAVAAVIVTTTVAPASATQGGEKPFTYGDCVSELATGNLEGETPREFNESSDPLHSQGKNPNKGISIGCIGAPPGN